MSRDCKKTTTVTVTHYARLKNRILTHENTPDYDAIRMLPMADQEAIRDLHHAFVFIASCERRFDAVYAVCYGRRGWSFDKINKLFTLWEKSGEDWKVLARHKDKLAFRPKLKPAPKLILRRGTISN